MTTIDLKKSTIRELNEKLQGGLPGKKFIVNNTVGKHALSVGLTKEIDVEINGHVGYYCAGMNQEASIKINGNAGPGLAENMMSGEVRVTGNASQYAGATAHGGLLIIEGDASSRCGISMKGMNIVVGGNIGHMSAFMAQSGNLVVCGDAGDALGDSIYETKIFVRGKVKSLGTDCVEKEMKKEHKDELAKLLEMAKMNYSVDEFRRYGSARKLYNFDIDQVDDY
ncbi:MAG: protein glxC [Pseudomonadota bacterium]|nr:protein glxC [Pseudomonadota bacterium]